MKKPALTLMLALVLLLNACQAASSGTPPPAPVEAASSTPSPIPPTLPFTPAPPTETPTSTPIPEKISSPDGMIQVQIPAGTFHMGAYDVNADPDEMPAHEVSMPSFWMDKLEITNGMYALCIQAGACAQNHPVFSQRQPNYFRDPAFRDYPVVNVSWEDASTYCKWAGRRLPTEAEWERAARGDDLRTYPWGDEPPSSIYANFDNIVHDTTRVGSYTAGASPFGVLDMAGNVWEWVDDLYISDYYQTASGTNPAGPTQTPGRINRVIRGGSYQDSFVEVRVSNRGNFPGPNLSLPAYNPERFGPASVKIGFRCAQDH